MTYPTHHLAPKTDSKRKFKKALFLISVGLTSMIMISCSSNSTGTDGGGGTNGGNGGSEPIGTEPTFTNVLQIFEQNCGNCHIGTRTSGVRLNTYENVIESVGDQYGVKVVQPNDAAGSPLVDKIEPSPAQGARMPQGGPFLSSDRIAQIRQWIDNGALNN